MNELLTEAIKAHGGNTRRRQLTQRSLRSEGYARKRRLPGTVLWRGRQSPSWLRSCGLRSTEYPRGLNAASPNPALSARSAGGSRADAEEPDATLH
ncbi:hypothetical protein SY2F82_35220 [Streptomyces sp. Y2F8-2]|nr:hypothetical protein SY2F82_35220 [Streptomyces sp. Y2F8-2]